MNEGIPTELLEALKAMGVDYGVPDGPRPTTALPPKLESWLERMDATHVGHVLKRFAPGDKSATGKAARVGAITRAISSKAQLDKVVSGLSPLEHRLLWQVKKGGGMLDGWHLVAVALMLNLEPPERPSSATQIYGRPLSDELPGRGYLVGMLRDGLLLPASTSTLWSGRSYYYDADPTSVVWADGRLLDALPEPPKQDWVKVKLNTVDVQDLPASTRSHAHVLLELTETFKLILEEGQMAFNKDGGLSKAYIKRLFKKRPALEATLPLYLGLIPWMGLMTNTDPVRPDLRVWSIFRTTPLADRYGAALAAYGGHYQEGGDAYHARDPQIPFALTQALRLLPGSVSLDAALDALNRRMLRYFNTSTAHSWNRRPSDLPSTDAYKALLEGDFALLALAEVVTPGAKTGAGKTEGNQKILRLGAGLEWLERETRKDAGAGVSPLKPPLVVQPNFEVMVFLERLNSEALTALEAMDLVRLDAQTATYTLTRTSVYRALESGLTLDTLLETLQTQSSLPLSSAMVSTLRDWAGRRDRITVTGGVTLLEFPSRAARDARLETHKVLTPVGETYALTGGKAIPKDWVSYRYDTAPERSLRFSGNDLLLEGPGDWLVQDLLSSFAVRAGVGRYTLEMDALRAGKLTPERKAALEGRLKGPFPRALNTLLDLWNGKQKPPALVPSTLFQHPQAMFLAEHPRLKPFLMQPLNATTYAVDTAKVKDFQKVLAELHISISTTLETGSAQSVQSTLLENIPTRKLRELIEDAIEAGRTLDLKYHEEKYAGGWGPKTQGKLRREKITPSSVVYEASTPYFVGKTEEGDSRRVRIGYIQGIAVI